MSHKTIEDKINTERADYSKTQRSEDGIRIKNSLTKSGVVLGQMKTNVNKMQNSPYSKTSYIENHQVCKSLKNEDLRTHCFVD